MGLNAVGREGEETSEGDGVR